MSLRILIADDDPAIRLLLRRFLEERPGWQVCAEAENGADAIDLVSRVALDLVILDLGMPVMNGLEAARRISQIKPVIRMLLISVQDISSQLATAAREAGFDGAITKNRGHEVVQAVDALLRNECVPVAQPPNTGPRRL